MRRPLVVLVVALVFVVAAAVAVVGVLTIADDDPPKAVRAPEAPSDLCAVIGVDDLAAWVPDAEWVAESDGNVLNTEASCRVDTEGGTTEDLEYGSLYARVYRYGSIGDDVPAEDQAVEEITQRCQGAVEGDVGLGDDSCVTYLDDAVETGHAAVSVRVGADLVDVTHYARPLTAAEARERAVDAAAAIVARLRR